VIVEGKDVESRRVSPFRFLLKVRSGYSSLRMIMILNLNTSKRANACIDCGESRENGCIT
jgi:hypothetical protein